MFPTDKFPFTGEALFNWLRHDLALDYWRSRSGRSILTDIRSRGAQIADSTFFNIRREVLGVERFFSNLQNLRETSLVPRSWLVENHGWQLSQNFLYNFQVEVVSNRTGLTEVILYSISTNREQTVGDLALEIIRVLETVSADTDWTVLGSNMRFALARPGVFDE